MTHATKRWSFSTGERGRNRVRVFEHPATGRIFLELYEGAKRKRIALRHRDREAAKAKAEEVAAALRRTAGQRAAPRTLETLFDIYMREVSPQKRASVQQHDRSAVTLFLEFFGPDRDVRTLNRRDWDGFVRWRRREGDRRGGRARGQPVRNRTIDYDLELLQAVLNWATTAGDGSGGLLLERNPLKGMLSPKDDDPCRPLLEDQQYGALLRSSRRVSPLFELALVLARETGHRLGALRLLRWSDIDLDRAQVRWRAANDKIGFDHETPLARAAIAALRRARAERPSIADAWVLPSPADQSKPCSRHLLRAWWRRGERLAGLAHEAGRGWHSLRRAFATALKHAPLKDLCYLGGWKNPQTVLKCYQRPDPITMRQVLAARRRIQGL